MTSRFLSFVALSGMLIAAGCSGGGAGSGAGSLSSGITPAGPSTGGSTGGSAKATNGSGASFSVSFLVPKSAVPASTSSSSRKVDYVSPGSTGLQVLLTTNQASCTAPTFAVGTASTPLQLQPTPPGGITANINSGTCGANATTSAGVSGTALLASNTFTETNSAATVYSINTVPGSATITPVVKQIVQIPGQNGAVATTESFTIQSVTGSVSTGFIMTATTAGTNPGLSFSTGAVMTFLPGSSTTSTYNYTFAPMSNTVAGSGALGYYQATITFNNMTGGFNYTIGVVLTDTNNNNFVLSENQTAATPVATQGVTAFPTLTLLPVVAGVFIPPVSVIPANTLSGATPGSFETTVFLTDERGYVIPNQGGVAAADDTPVVTIAPGTAGALTFGTYTAAAGYVQLPATTTSLTTAPGTATFSAAPSPVTISAASAAPNYANLFGSLLGNYLLPTAPLALSLNGATSAALGGQVITNGNGVGNPLNITCAPTFTGTYTLKVQLQTTTPATVNGYTLVPGTNYPATGPATLANGAYVSTPSINCTPVISLPIN